jgi:hypothetical protein
MTPVVVMWSGVVKVPDPDPGKSLDIALIPVIQVKEDVTTTDASSAAVGQ